MNYIVTYMFLHHGLFVNRIVKEYENVSRQQLMSRVMLFIQTKEHNGFELESLFISQYEGELTCLLADETKKSGAVKRSGSANGADESEAKDSG